MTARHTAAAGGVGFAVGALAAGPAGAVVAAAASALGTHVWQTRKALPAGKQSVDMPPASGFTLPESGPAREAAILGYIDAGQYAAKWVPVTSNAAGHTATFQLMTDALKIFGVRINAGARLEQQIADRLGCSLLTAKIADLLFLARSVALLPMPISITTSSAAMVSHSAQIDDAIRQAGVSKQSKAGVIQTVGKHWIIDNDLASHPGRACNYGWQFEGTFAGSSWGAAVTPGLRAVQDRGFAHGLDQDDYSQTVVLVHKSCVIDGRTQDLAQVLTDPDLSQLASHQGPLTILRQPGVA